MVGTLPSKCRGYRFHPWLGSWDSTCLEAKETKAENRSNVVTNSVKTLKNFFSWASLVAKWMRLHLSMQGTQVRILVWADLLCLRAAKPVPHNC